MIQLVVIGLFLRSNLTFGSSYISLITLLILIISFYVLLIPERKINKLYVFITVLIIFHYLVEVIYLIEYFGIEEFKDFYYTLSILPMMLIIHRAIKINPERLFASLSNILLILYTVSTIIVILEITTGIHLPGSRANDAGNGVYAAYLANIPTGFFYNPNDMSMHIILFFPLLYCILRKRYNNKLLFFFTIITAFLLLATLSRSALILFIFFPLFLQFIKGKFKKIIISYTILLSVVVSFFKFSPEKINADGVIGYNYNRIMSIANVSSELESNNSIGTRLDVFGLFFSNPENFLLGNGFQSKYSVLNNSSVLTDHPHSLVIEFIFNFGIIGTIPIFIVIFYPFFYSSINFSKNIVYRFIVVQSFFLYVAMHIPATSIRYVSVWLVLAILYSLMYLVQVKNTIPEFLLKLKK